MRTDSPNASDCEVIAEEFVTLYDPVETPTVPSPPIVVYSLDGDGCFLPHVTTDKPYCTLAEYNQSFLTECVNKRLKNNNEHLVFMIGSARQNWLRDISCMYQQINGFHFLTESYFFAFRKFVDDCHRHFPDLTSRIELDPFLLDDISFNRESGESFAKAVNGYGQAWNDFLQSQLNGEKKLPNTVDDEILPSTIRTLTQQAVSTVYSSDVTHSSQHKIFLEHRDKFALLYAQMHHIASKFQKSVIAFHFYDNDVDILYPLYAIFVHEPNLLPKNLTLYLHHYIEGKQQQNKDDQCPVIKVISGIGPIDTQYRDTFMSIATRMLQTKILSLNNQQTLPCVHGNPLKIFFSCVVDACCSFFQVLPQSINIVSKPEFHQFEAERQRRLEETTSLASFVETMQRAFKSRQNHGNSEPASTGQPGCFS